MRLPFIAVFLLLPLTGAHAQIQEKTMLERMLGKPDQKLVNSAQDKKFSAGGSGSLNKSATIATFHFHENSVAKKYEGDREFPAKSFSAQRFGPGDTAANLSTRGGIANAHTRYQTVAATALKDARESSQTMAVREFAEARPFLEEGKSQKVLSQHDRPMTIDEIRELLNKNK